MYTHRIECIKQPNNFVKLFAWFSDSGYLLKCSVGLGFLDVINSLIFRINKIFTIQFHDKSLSKIINYVYTDYVLNN